MHIVGFITTLVFAMERELLTVMICTNFLEYMPTGLAFDLWLADFIVFGKILKKICQDVVNWFHAIISINYSF
jgi:hypothetical protein